MGMIMAEKPHRLMERLMGCVFFLSSNYSRSGLRPNNGFILWVLAVDAMGFEMKIG
jgi:hypothetical protein